MTPFPTRCLGDYKWSEIEASLAAIMAGKRGPLIGHGRPMIAGRSWWYRGQSAIAPCDPLFGPKARLRLPYFWRHFHAADEVAKNAPTFRNP